jgi:glycerophosphoryl diester phosphodiesterase
MRLIAHRGASGLAPENTLAAFRLALRSGAEALELDVHQTADKELVVLHDEDLRRVAGRPEAVRDLTWQELCRFDVGNWFDPKFQGERVPRLEEIFDLVGQRAELHIELKRGSRLYPGIEKAVLKLLLRRRALKSCVVSSFDHEALFTIRALAPRLRLGYLLGATWLPKAWREIKALAAESLNLSSRQATSERVRAAHRRGTRVLVYTVNDVEAARRMKRLGVDGIYSNFPELLKDE